MAVQFKSALSPRLRTAQVLALLNVSKSTFYAGIASGRYPKPDGKDGQVTFWREETIRPYL